MSRGEFCKTERSLNYHLKFWTKMLKSGANHNHQKRILDSKICSSENAAPKYFMFKDHKVEGGWRPAVGGCSSGTLGLSNILSEVVEAVCVATENLFEVISSEDMLSRVIACYAKIDNMAENENWSLDQDWILLKWDSRTTIGNNFNYLLLFMCKCINRNLRFNMQTFLLLVDLSLNRRHI